MPGKYFPFPYDFASITSKLPVEYFTILYDFGQYSTGIDFWMLFRSIFLSKKVEMECQYLTNLKLAFENTQWHSKKQLGGYWASPNTLLVAFLNTIEYFSIPISNQLGIATISAMHQDGSSFVGKKNRQVIDCG